MQEKYAAEQLCPKQQFKNNNNRKPV